MSELFRAWMADLTVPSGSNVSRTVDMAKEAYDAEAFMIQAPADIDSKTYTIEVSLTYSGSIVWATLKDLAGDSVRVPALSTAITYNGVITVCRYWRIKASGNTSQDVTFLVAKSSRA